MKKTPDPIRLADDGATPERLADALRLARRGPDGRAVKSLSGALGVAAPLAPPAVPPAAGLAAASGGSGVSLGIVGLASVAAAGIGAGAIALSVSHGSDAPPVVSPRAVVTAIAPTHLAPAPVAPAEVASAEPAPSPVPVVRRRLPEPVSVAPPSAPEEAPAPAPAASAPPAPAAPPAAQALASRLREEALLVRNAERLLGSDPGAALRMTEERRRRFPGGALDQEAEVVAIDALLRLGRRAAATARAQAFEASHPGSLHARRIRALVGSNP